MSTHPEPRRPYPPLVACPYCSTSFPPFPSALDPARTQCPACRRFAYLAEPERGSP